MRCAQVKSSFAALSPLRSGRPALQNGAIHLGQGTVHEEFAPPGRRRELRPGTSSSRKRPLRGRLRMWSAPAKRSGDGALAFWSGALRSSGPGGQGVAPGAPERTVTDAWTGQPKRGRRCALPPRSKTGPSTSDRGRFMSREPLPKTDVS